MAFKPRKDSKQKSTSNESEDTGKDNTIVGTINGDLVKGDKAGGHIVKGNTFGNHADFRVINNYHYAGEPPVKKEDIPNHLRKASKSYFEHLTRQNGRFGHLGKDGEDAFEPMGSVYHEILASVEIESSPFINKTEQEEEQIPGSFDTTSYGASSTEEGVSRGYEPVLLEDKLNDFWAKSIDFESVHTLLLGEAGMGKTVNLLWIWKHYLESEDAPIPLFLSLKEYNNVPPGQRKEFLLEQILRLYLGERQRGKSSEKALKEWLKEEWEEKRPKLILLLDGWNEITVSTSVLFKELTDFWTVQAGTQIVISSRQEVQQAVEGFRQFHIIKLLPLHISCIERYIQKINSDKPLPKDAKMLSLLSNPLMLSLFIDIKNTESTDTRFHFKGNETTSGELIWNFVETKLQALFKNSDDAKIHDNAYCHFLNKHILPFVAFEMLRLGLYEIPESFLEELVNEAFEEFNESAYFAKFRSFRPHVRIYRKYLDHFELGEISWQNKIQRFEEILEKFKLEIFPFSEGNGLYQFLHQSFRDFYAAIFLYDRIRLEMEDGLIPSVLKDQIIPIDIMIILGELEGEQYNKPRFIQKEENKEYVWTTANYSDTLFTEILNICRVSKDDLGYTLYNIIEMWKVVRGELSGADLSNLDLRQLSFSNTRISRPGLSGRWNNSKLSTSQFFPPGHEDAVVSIEFGAEGKYMLTAGRDGVIKMWSLEFNNVIQHFRGHKAPIFKIIIVDNHQFISIGVDSFIKRWSMEDGVCLGTYPAPECFNPILLKKTRKFINYSDTWSRRWYNMELNKRVSLFDKNYTKALNGGIDLYRSLVYKSRQRKQPLLVSYGEHLVYYSKKEWLIYVADGAITFWSIKEASVKFRVVRKDRNDGVYDDILSLSSDQSILIVSALGGTLITLIPVEEFIRKKTFPGNIKGFQLDEGLVSIQALENKNEFLIATRKRKNFICQFELNEKDELTGSLREVFQISSSTDRFYNQNFPPSGTYLNAICPDNKYLAVYTMGTKGCSFKVFVIETGECLFDFSQTSDIPKILSLQFSPTADKLLAGTFDGAIHAWSIRTGQKSYILRGSRKRLVAPSVFDAKNNLLAIIASDNTMKIFAPGNFMNTDKGTKENGNAESNPGMQPYQVIRLKSATRISFPESNAISTDAKYIAAFEQFNEYIIYYVWDIQSGKLIFEKRIENINSKFKGTPVVSFRPKSIFISNANQIMIMTDSIHVYNLEDGTLAYEEKKMEYTKLRASGENVSVVYKADGDKYIVYNEKGVLELDEKLQTTTGSDLPNFVDRLLCFNGKGDKVLFLKEDHLILSQYESINDIVKKISLPTKEYLTRALFKPDDAGIIIITSSNLIYYHHISTSNEDWKVLNSNPTGESGPDSIYISSDSNRLIEGIEQQKGPSSKFGSKPVRFQFTDVKSKETQWLNGLKGTISDFFLPEEGDMIFIATLEGHLMHYSLSENKVVTTIENHSLQVQGSLFADVDWVDVNEAQKNALGQYGADIHER